jgi:hypothetical protein
MFFGQTSNSAVVRAAAKSNVNHEPFPTPHNTDIVLKTRDRVSSEVSSKNSPRSLIIHGTIANSAFKMYSTKLDQIGSAQMHLKEDKAMNCWMDLIAETLKGISVSLDSITYIAASKYCP